MKYLMVCLGNICRSPLAEGILKHKLQKINSTSVVESRGFEPYHEGDFADKRAQFIAQNFGVDLSKHKSKLFSIEDFDNFDFIFVMDKNNYQHVSEVARNKADLEKVDYIMNVLFPGENIEVPDPYYGENEGFLHVWKMLSEACDSIVEKFEK
jgi:protein-tyrosine phosphatase